MPEKILITMLYAILSVIILLICYFICCKCILINSYARDEEIRNEMNQRRMERQNAMERRNAIERAIEQEINIEIAEQRRMIENLKKKYKIIYGSDNEEMEEDTEHVIIVGPNGNQISLGKKITE
jgi:hypothetical protein